MYLLLFGARAGRDCVLDASIRRLSLLQQGDRVGRSPSQADHSCHARTDVLASRRSYVAHLCTTRLR